MNRLIAVSIALLLARCATIPPPRGTADGAVIDDVELIGVEAVDADTLAEGLANRPPLGFFHRRYARFDQLAVALDRRRIASFYARYGYFGTRVRGPDTEPATEGRVVVKWFVEEGPPSILRTVGFEGAPDDGPDQRRLVDAANLSVDEVFSYADYAAAKARLRALYVRAGYAYAKVEGVVEVSRQDKTVGVVFKLDPGPLVSFGALSVEGPVRTPTSAVVHRQTFELGEQFSPVPLTRMRGRLYQLGFYNTVQLDYADEDQNERADIAVKIEEAEPNELQLGVGGALDPQTVEVRLRGGYLRRSFPLPLTTTEIEVRPAYSFLRASLDEGAFTPKARLTVAWYDFLLPLVKLNNTVGLNFVQLEAYTWRGLDIGQTLSRPFGDDRLQVALGWHYYQYGFNQDLLAEDAAALGIDDSLPVVTFEPSITFDGRDDALLPRSGVFAQLKLEVGHAFREGFGAYAVLIPELRGYLPVGQWLVLAARARLGARLTGRLAAPRRFFAGGANSQRGFAQRRLSPVGLRMDDDPPTEVPIGDETLLETNAEVRLFVAKPFGYWLSVAGFIDGAELVPRIADVDVTDLHWATGGGIRYYTPIGAVRLDFGFRLNRLNEDDPVPNDSWAFHLTLGDAF